MAVSTEVRDRPGIVSQLLEFVCHAIQLTRTQYQSACQHYQAVGNWFDADGSQLKEYNPSVYPQGSMALETTVRPRGRVEFDLDAITVLHHPDGADVNPNELYRAVRARVAASGTFSQLLEPHDKCIRLSYANDFHLDIVPAIPDPIVGGTAILIPRQVGGGWIWLKNDPKRFQRWFDDMSINEEIKLAFRAEPIPEQRPAANKDCLRRSVQLLKRRRDVYYNGDGLTPSSIVLTTLAGETHPGGDLCGPALGVMLRAIKNRIENGQGRITVRNPIDKNEIFTACWSQEQHDTFADFIQDFIDRFDSLVLAKGLPAIGEALGKLFDTSGKSVAKEALVNYEEGVSNVRRHQGVGVTSTGLIVPAAAAVAVVKPNTFYGNG